MARRRFFVSAAIMALSAASLAHAEGAAPQDTSVSEVVVTSRRLNDARATIEPSLGATTYSVTNATIQALPAGDNQQLSQVVLQLPGVVQDGRGQLHVREDHNGLQYRLNGVILPEGISVFGQTLSPRLVGKLDVLTGALPAQYGLRTAGIVATRRDAQTIYYRLASKAAGSVMTTLAEIYCRRRPRKSVH